MRDRSPKSVDAPLEGCTVLLLEDESLIVLDTMLALEERGARTLHSPSPDTALRLLEEHVVDAAVLDVTLGGGRTCEPVARRLDELDVPYLLYTGDSERNETLVRRLGAPVVSKPCPSHRLAGRVTRLLDGTPRARR